ncbi:DUF968 domain-containing protein [Halomonas sp. V046]|uniref:DUF968 domain-containing protein n=1 Tax=Halomonas sp. V046 TaxID=3459611 RepID=UPI00404513BC
MNRGQPLQRRTPLKAKAPMARKPVKRGLSSKNRHSTKHKQPCVSPAKDKRFRSPAYLAFVRTLPCCRCGAPADDAHHVIGLHWGLSGMGTTAPDSFAMPTCRPCHQDIHRLPELQRYQPDWLRHVIARGVRQFSGDIRSELIRAWEFIDEKEAA